MRVLLRELESNQLALLLVTLAFLLILMLLGVVLSNLFGVDWNAILGIAGMGTGSHVSTATNQALQARSPNYTPQATTITPPTPIPSAPGPTPSPPAQAPVPPPHNLP